MPRWSENRTVTGARSVLFHLVSGVVTAAFLALFPLILAPRSVVWAVIKVYVRVQLWLLATICGLTYRIEGLENLPAGPCVLACRHEALWETLCLPVIFGNPAVFLKQEILRWPVAGAVARKLGYIGVDRSGSVDRVKHMFETARAITRSGRSLLIFPNGTRAPASRDRVQKGVSVLYRSLKLPCVPILLDSGDFWPYQSWMRRPGCITVRIGPALQPGLDADVFQNRLESALSRSV